MNSLLTGYSKKLVAFLAYLGVVLCNNWAEIGLSDETIYAVTAALVGYCGSQGLSDFGKERGKIEAKAKLTAKAAKQ